MIKKNGNYALIHFNRAKSELAKATNIDEVKTIRDKAEALRVYAKQAGECLEMQNQCAEIKIRAERRAGEMLKNMPKNTGGGDTSGGNIVQPPQEPPKLSDIGINKSQSSRWQKIAEIPEEDFEKHIIETKEKKGELTSYSVQKLALQIKQPQETETPDLPHKKYRIIYADPPWKYRDENLPGYGSARRYYPTLSIDEICELKVADLAEENSVLFLWVTSPFLEDCFKVIKAWGFKYKASFVWNKVKHNCGHYNSVRHEFLLICTKGSCLPDEKKLFNSVLSLPRTKKYSEKPDEFREMIDTLYTRGNKIELFARPKEGVPKWWDTWGNEITK